MSKIGNLNLELQEQANELGYSTVQEALDNGYTITYNETGQWLISDGQEEAHEAWLEEKRQVLADLAAVADSLPAGSGVQGAVEHAIEFIEKGEV